MLSRFLTGLRERRILGARGADGRVLVPPLEYDPVTAEPLTELVEVGPTGTVRQLGLDAASRWPASRWTDPFAWALIRLDGADTALLHAVDAGSAAADAHRHAGAGPLGGASRSATSATSPASSRDDGPEPAAGAPRDRRTRQPSRSRSRRSHAGPAALPAHRLARGEPPTCAALADRAAPRPALPGVRARSTCRRAAPARPTACRPTEEVELPDTGTVTTFCIVNVPFPASACKPPYVAAHDPARRRRHRRSCT